MGNIAISVEHLGKRYRIGHAAARPENVREAARAFVSAPFRYLRTRLREPEPDELLWALKDVSFEVKHGEVLGIIGRNGAGKSTLLKILSRITEPTEGCAKVYGRVGSLLEVGTGFHPELTGRENIYLNGTILGMKRAEIDKKFDEIVEFSGIEKFLDTPVKRYSSGMYVRLAFAVAAHLEPEILIVDEVLAVGDAEFQKKCLGKMKDVAKEGRTVLFVSHNMLAIQSLCHRAIFLKNGVVSVIGDIHVVVKNYLTSVESGLRDSQVQALTNNNLKSISRDRGLTPVFVEGFVNTSPLRGVHSLLPEKDIAFKFVVKLDHAYRKCTFGIHFEDELGLVIYVVHTRWLLKPFDLEQGTYEVHCVVPCIPLVPNDYYVSIGFSAEEKQIDRLPRVCCIRLVPYDVYKTGELPDLQGYFLSRGAWKFSRLSI